MWQQVGDLGRGYGPEEANISCGEAQTVNTYGRVPPKHNALAVYWDMSSFLHGFAFSQFRSTIRVGFFSCHKRSVTGDSPVFCNRCVSPVDDSNHNKGDCVFS